MNCGYPNGYLFELCEKVAKFVNFVLDLGKIKLDLDLACVRSNVLQVVVHFGNCTYRVFRIVFLDVIN